MKAVILAGGRGSRLSEETVSKPKPMVEIGGRPILWHIMKIFGSYGVKDFVICLGYRGYLIKEYFSNYFLHTSNVTFDMKHNRMRVHQRFAEDWRVTLVDTGDETMTGGRLKRVREFLGNAPFFFTYGDGVGDVDLAALRLFHRKQGKLATVTCVQPPARFGRLSIQKNLVRTFEEKPEGDGQWINGGFFLMSPKAVDYIDGDSTVWERGPMEKIAGEGQLAAYRHSGFWQPMDTLRDRLHLEQLWESGNAPWKTW